MKDMNSPTIFYIVLIIAVLNVLGYTSTKDWNSLTFFLLASGVTYAVTQHRVLSLVVGVVGASLFRASGVMHREGLTTRRSKIAPDHSDDEDTDIYASTKEPDNTRVEAEDDYSINAFENFEGQIKKQRQMLKLSKEMAPIAKSMNQLIKNLPEGFIENALETLKNKKNRTLR